MDFDIYNVKLSISEAKQLNPLVLAFVGDAIYEVLVRTYIVNKNKDMKVHKLHVKAISFVKAHAQSEFMKMLMNELNQEEMSIFKRGRNTKSATVPKNANVTEYRIATGFEALFGYLYISNQNNRLNEIFKLIIEAYEEG